MVQQNGEGVGYKGDIDVDDVRRLQALTSLLSGGEYAKAPRSKSASLLLPPTAASAADVYDPYYSSNDYDDKQKYVEGGGGISTPWTLAARSIRSRVISHALSVALAV